MIRNIVKVERCDTAILANSIISGKDNMSCYAVDELFFTDVCAIGLSNVEVSDDVKDKSRVWTTKLTVILSKRFIIDKNPQSFRVTDATGASYLIGIPNEPNTVLTWQDVYADKTSSNSAAKLTVTWIARVPMLKVFQSV